MKRFFIISITIILIISIVACGNDNSAQVELEKLQKEMEALQAQITSEPEPEPKPEPKLAPEPTPEPIEEGLLIQVSDPIDPADVFDSEAIVNNLKVHEFSYESSTGRPWVFLVVENTSEFTLDISASLKTFDDSGGLVGAKNTSESPVGAGQITILSFMLDNSFETSEYEIDVSEETWSSPVTQNLVFETSSADGREIITVTNNGDIPARFVEVYVLFFSNGILVDHDRRYFTDSDSEIKPGKSITEELRTRQKYDSIIVVLTGRG